MALVWLAECKICAQRFALLPREPVAGKRGVPGKPDVGLLGRKSTAALPPNAAVGRFECPHCHEVQDYSTADLIPGEGRIIASHSPARESPEE